MREILTLCGKLLLIALIAGLALGLVISITKEPIRQQELKEANEARFTVLPAASSFTEGENGVYKGLDANGQTVGLVLSGKTKGYGGTIEVTLGIDLQGTITGVNVGGSDFSETAGLGEKTRSDPAWRAQFVGMNGPVSLAKDGGTIDAVTSATISSRAVTNEVEVLRQTLVAALEGVN